MNKFAKLLQTHMWLVLLVLSPIWYFWVFFCQFETRYTSILSIIFGFLVPCTSYLVTVIFFCIVWPCLTVGHFPKPVPYLYFRQRDDYVCLSIRFTPFSVFMAYCSRPCSIIFGFLAASSNLLQSYLNDPSPLKLCHCQLWRDSHHSRDSKNQSEPISFFIHDFLAIFTTLKKRSF